MNVEDRQTNVCNPIPVNTGHFLGVLVRQTERACEHLDLSDGESPKPSGSVEQRFPSWP